MLQNEPPPGLLARLFRALALASVVLGACVGYALWAAREGIAEQGYAALGFGRSEYLELTAAAWEGWARGLYLAPRVAMGVFVLLLVFWAAPMLRPTPSNLHRAVAGTGRAFLVFAAGAGLLGLLWLHLLEREWLRSDGWLGLGDLVAASTAFVVAYAGLAFTAQRAQNEAGRGRVYGMLWATAVLAFGGYWLNRGLWAPPRETHVVLRNLLLVGAALLVSKFARSTRLRDLCAFLWRPLVALSLLVAAAPVILRGMEDSRGQPSLRAQTPWNVLVIALDTVRFDYTSFSGVERQGPERTPRLRELVDQGVNFRGAISQAPWTLPAFASVMTGKYPQEHGAFRLDAKLRRSELTLTEVLREAGYQTFGIVSHLYLENYRGMAQGFERFDESQALGHEAVTSIQVTERAIRMLDQADRGRPFFMFAHYFDPHWEYRDHEGWGYADRYQGWLTDQLDLDNLHKNRHLLDEDDLDYLSGLYQEELAYTDRHIGRLLDHLKESGLAENTLIVLVSDHGEEFMEHGGLDHTTTVFQELVHVPLAIVLPPAARDRATSGTVVTGTVETRRVFGTVLELLDVRAPMLGPARAESLLMRSGGEFEARTAPAFTSVWLEDTAPRWGKRFKLAALVDGSWKFVNDLTRGREMLYDLEADPGEQKDVKGRNAERTQAMRTRLHAWIQEMQTAAVGLESANVPAGDLTILQSLGYVGDDAEDSPKGTE